MVLWGIFAFGVGNWEKARRSITILVAATAAEWAITN